MIGSMLVKLAFAGVVFSAISYFLSSRKKEEAWAIRGRYGFYIAALGTILSAGFLLYLLLTHQFQFTYVWNYSSTSLSTPLLISTLYAGQEGSFMLWALYTSIIGLILMQYSAKRGYEAEIMFVYSLILTFLLLMLIIKNPFAYVWESFPKEVRVGFLPANGRGLNPLLQNFWMVIHPPILFIGFTALSVPFAHAVAALMKRDYHHWIRAATPWTIFGVAVLGTGITLGGFWAYETLGWGGYWGWDPVENSSLIPWLFCLASVHTILSQRRRGTFVRTNFVLGMLPFLLVLYSTFLTRSGVLADTSVHSFVEPGMWAYIVLLGVIIVFTFLGFGLFFRRMKDMPKVKVEHSIVSREIALFLGASALIICSVFILAGTSAPLITGFFQEKPSAVDISFYHTTTLPLAVVIALLSGIGQLLWWKQSGKNSLRRNLLWPAIAAAVLTLLLYSIGMKESSAIILSFAAAFMLFANSDVAYRIFKGNPILAGGSIAHIGVAFFFFGIIAGSFYSEQQTVSLEQGQPVETLGWTLKYVGSHPIDEKRYGFKVEVEKDGKKWLLTPVMYYSEYSKGIMRNPDIANFLTQDFYLSPVSLDAPEEGNSKNVTLTKGRAEQVSDYRITFVDFDFSNIEKGKMLEGGEFTIGAKLLVEKYGKKATILPKMKNTAGSITYEPANFEDLRVTIAHVQPDRENSANSTVEVKIAIGEVNSQRNNNVETLVVEASIKPFINIVWFGTFTILVGFVLTIVRRLKETKGRMYSEEP